MSTIALMGAGGKIGLRITKNLKDSIDHTTLYVEISEAGKAKLAELRVQATSQEEALKSADVVILAVPDVLIGKICADIVPGLRSRTMVIGLDPAAAYAGVLPKRPDITYFVAHPCHPPLFNEETSPEARQDWYGGIARQSIVCALHHGPEEDYAKGEAIARAMFAPVTRAHHLSVEQMAILEPALTEQLTRSCVLTIHEGMEEAIRMGVPEAAVRDFLFGHLRIGLATVFGISGITISDGAKLATKMVRGQILKPDWKKVLRLVNIKKSVREITRAQTSGRDD